MSDEKQYAQGGFIAAFDGSRSDDVPILLSRGCVLVSSSSYQRVGRKALEALFPNSDIEVVFSASEVKEYGEAALEKLLRTERGGQNDAADDPGGTDSSQ